MSGSGKALPPIVTHLLLAAPFVPNIERLLDRHGEALGIPRSTYFEAYDTSITVPHGCGVLRFQLVEGPLSGGRDQTADLSSHKMHLTISGSWQDGTPASAAARQAIVVAELLEQTGDARAVVWQGENFALDAFLAAMSDGELPVQAPLPRQQSPERTRDHAAKPSLLGRLFGRNR